MDAIYPVTALQKQQGEVKKAAQAGIVRITENGKGAYVFCSEDVFERMMQQVAEDAASEARLAALVNRGHADIAAGRVFRGTQAAMDEVEKRMHGHA